MNRITTIVSVTAISAVMAIAVASPALAWHPKGTIVKQVQNITQGGALADANTAAAAVSAKPGDTLKYVITVSNNGDVNPNGDNDMVNTKVTDTLPAGVALLDNTTRNINLDLGKIAPGKSVSREVTVKVTSTKDGDLVDNEACFTGDSAINDAPQKGCDNAIVTVTVPPVVTPPTPVTPETTTPVTPATPAPVTTLPETGASSPILGASVATVLAYGAAMLARRIRK